MNNLMNLLRTVRQVATRGGGDGLVVRRVHSPPFSRRGGCASVKRSRSSAAQTGGLVISNKIRIATRAYKEATRPFTNHPVCAAEERNLFTERSLPSLKTEGNELASTGFIDFEIAWLGAEIRRLYALQSLISQPVGQF